MRVERDHHDEADSQDVEGGKALVHQHLVHHHLKEQRRHQGEQLQEERGDKRPRETAGGI